MIPCQLKGYADILVQGGAGPVLITSIVLLEKSYVSEVW